MAKTVNKVTLLGNLGRAPEVKATRNSSLVASFSMATVNRYKNDNGEWLESTEWHNCVAFGKLAEIVRDYVSKGSKLYLEGRLQTRSWDDEKSGTKKYKTEILVSDVTLLGAPGGRPAPVEQREGASRTGGDDGMRGYHPSTVPEITDDDIPF